MISMETKESLKSITVASATGIAIDLNVQISTYVECTDNPH